MKHCTKRDGKSFVSIKQGVIVLRFEDGHRRRHKVVGCRFVEIEEEDND